MLEINNATSSNELFSVARTITIVSEMHCSRKLGGVETADWHRAKAAIIDGCELQMAKFVLRHPEVMLCDLSNPDERLSRCDSIDIEAIFKSIDQGLCKQGLPDGVRRIEGDGLHPEIALSGPVKKDLEQLRDRILAKEYSKFMIEPAVVALHGRGLHRSVSLRKASALTQDLYSEFCAFYGQFIDPAKWTATGALNVRSIYSDHDVWTALMPLAQNKLFVVSAGLALGLGYVNATQDSRVYFTEVHRQNDPALLHKSEPFEGVFPEPERDGSSWLLMDKAYTGGTIQLAAKRLRERVGAAADIKTVALFPKSLAAVLSCDFVVYAGRLIEVRTIANQLHPDTWHIQLLYTGASTCS